MLVRRRFKGASKVLEAIILVLIVALLILVLVKLGKDSIAYIFHLADLPWGAGG